MRSVASMYSQHLLTCFLRRFLPWSHCLYESSPSPFLALLRPFFRGVLLEAVDKIVVDRLEEACAAVLPQLRYRGRDTVVVPEQGKHDLDGRIGVVVGIAMPHHTLAVDSKRALGEMVPYVSFGELSLPALGRVSIALGRSRSSRAGGSLP